MQQNQLAVMLIEQQIYVSRRKLQELWDVRGFTDSEILAASIELDDLINRYQKLQNKHLSILKIKRR
jgi:hypothetical protein